MSELHVLFRVGDGEYALPAELVLHMESYAGATPVPGAAAFVAGLVQVRGRVIPVIDLRARFGLPQTERSLSDRVLVIEDGGRQVGLIADEAREVMRIESERFQRPPELLEERGGSFISAVAHVGERLLMRLALPAVIGGAVTRVEEKHGEQRVAER